MTARTPALLSRELLARIEDAAIEASLFMPHRRELLMNGLPPRLWGSLRTQPDPITQLVTDIMTLNSFLTAPDIDAPPLALWLDNAARLIEGAGQVGGAAFRNWAEAVRAAANEATAAKPATTSVGVSPAAALGPVSMPSTPPILADLLDANADSLLADAFPTPAEARALLLRAGVPLERVRAMTTDPLTWWTEVLHRITSGLASLPHLLDCAAGERPHDPQLAALAHRFRPR